MAESYHERLKRVRKPRVHITYKVETEGAEIDRELPFVVGVLGDFSANPTEPLKPLRDRKFIQIDRDNFNEVMQRMTPGLNFRVENTLQGDGSEIAVQLKFNSMDDFEPANVAKQIEPLKKLMETREKLKELQTKVDLSPDLEQQWEEVLQNTDALQKTADEAGIEKPTDEEGDQGGEE